MRGQNMHENNKERTRNPDVFACVKAFNNKYGVKQAAFVADYKELVELIHLKRTLIEEEVKEFEDEHGTYMWCLTKRKEIPAELLANLTKELADIIYVVVGYADALHLPLNEVFSRVHESNMTKTKGNRRDDGKILR